MKICSNCKRENKDDAVFCTGCGRKFKKETDIAKIVLLVGVFLVLFSSIFFGILNWGIMNNLFRLLFFCFESCLFFLLSLALKKVSNVTSRIFLVIGLVLTPFTLALIPYYNLIPNILYNEALIYTYLAVLFLLTYAAYILINFKFKSKILDYLAYFSLLFSIICTVGVFTSSLTILAFVLVLYMLVLTIVSKFLTGNRVYYIFSIILSFLLIPLLIAVFLYKSDIEIIMSIIIFVLFVADLYLKMIFNKKSVMHFFTPFFLQLLSFVLICNMFGDSDTISIIALAAVNIVFYFVTLIFKNNMFSIVTLILTHILLAFLTFLCMVISNNMILVIVSLLALVYNLGLLIAKKYNFAHIFITLNVLFAVIGLNFWLYNFSSLIIVTFLSIIYLIIYLVLKLIKNKYDFIYLIIMLAIGLVSIFMELNGSFGIIKLILCITFIIGYILINIFKENIALRIIWFIILNGIIFTLFNNLYYGLLAASLFTIVTSVIFQKTLKLDYKPYLLYAEIAIFAATFFNTMHHSLISLFINVLAFVLGYLCVSYFHNKKPWKIAYIMVGLLYITKLIGVVIEPIVISSLIAILIDLIIIVSMYLLDRFNSKELVIISLVTLIPYYTLLGKGISTTSDELYLIPFVVYHVLLTFVIKWKSNTNRNVFILIPFFLFAVLFLFINSGVISTIICAVYALIYMIMGLVKKYNLLVFFAIGYLVLAILFQIFTVLNSMAAIIALLVVGFILIFVAVFYSTRKKD